MDITYDRVRDFCPKCVYCNKIFLNRELLANHFVTRHLLTSKNEFMCPHCCLTRYNIGSHVQSFHKNMCLFCGEKETEGAHTTCTQYVKNAIKNHFQRKITLLLNMLEGLQNI